MILMWWCDKNREILHIGSPYFIDFHDELFMWSWAWRLGWTKSGWPSIATITSPLIGASDKVCLRGRLRGTATIQLYSTDTVDVHSKLSCVRPISMSGTCMRNQVCPHFVSSSHFHSLRIIISLTPLLGLRGGVCFEAQIHLFNGVERTMWPTLPVP